MSMVHIATMSVEWGGGVRLEFELTSLQGCAPIPFDLVDLPA